MIRFIIGFFGAIFSAVTLGIIAVAIAIVTVVIVMSSASCSPTVMRTKGCRNRYEL
jgi:hypothetical protein